MNIYNNYVVLIVLFFAVTHNVISEEWRNYYNSPNINCILVDADDIWIGTTNGLVKYNVSNNTEEKFNIRNSILLSNQINAIRKDKAGVIWFATGFGLLKYHNSEFSIFFPSMDCLVQDYITDINFDSNGKLWIATSGGVAYRNDDKFEHLVMLSFNNTHFIHPFNNNKLVVIDWEYVKIYDIATKKIDTLQGMPASYETYLDAVVIDENNTLWYIRGRTLYKYDFNELRSKTLPHFVTAKMIKVENNLLIYDDKTIYKFDLLTEQFAKVTDALNFELRRFVNSEPLIALYDLPQSNLEINNKLAYIDDNFKYRKINTNMGNIDFPSHNLTDIIVVPDNRMLINQEVGLMMFDYPDWKQYYSITSNNINYEIGVNKVHSFFDSEGYYYYYSYEQESENHKVALVKTNFKNTEIIDLFPYPTRFANQYLKFFNYSNNNYFVFKEHDKNAENETYKFHLYMISPDTLIQIQEDFSISENRTFRAQTSRGKYLAFCSDNELIIYDGEQTSIIRDLPEFSNLFYATSMSFDANYRLWLIDNRGFLCKIEDLSIKRYDYNSGLPPGEIVEMKIDKNNVIWLGTKNGLVRFDGVNFKQYNVKNSEILSNNIMNIEIDKKNNVWILTDMGISILNEDEIILSANNPEDIHTENLKFDVYPNPFENTLNIKSDKLIKSDKINFEQTELMVISNKGEVVFKENINSLYQEFSLYLGFLSEGNYMLVVKSNSNIFSHKIIKVN